MYIKNNEKSIVETDFWTIPLVRDRFFLSFNAGACRILLPTRYRKYLRDMKAGKMNTITMGPSASLLGEIVYEVLFDDLSTTRYGMTTTLEASDRRLSASDHGKSVELSLWLPASRLNPTVPKCVMRREATIKISSVLGR